MKKQQPGLVVVDLGCYDHGAYHSLAELAAKFAPARMFGFDPAAGTDETLTEVAGVPVDVHRRAAWLYDGAVPYQPAGPGSHIADRGDLVACFDFSAWLTRLGDKQPVVVKMDIEGAEYPLLERMVADGTDRLVSRLLVEWHDDDGRAASLTEQLSCPTEEWWM